MKKELSRNEAIEKINLFFKQKDFKPEEMRKIKRLAMKHRIRLKEERKVFCKKCLAKLKGKTRISKKYRAIVCEKCGFQNKFLVKET